SRDWSSDVCSSDLTAVNHAKRFNHVVDLAGRVRFIRSSPTEIQLTEDYADFADEKLIRLQLSPGIRRLRGLGRFVLRLRVWIFRFWCAWRRCALCSGELSALFEPRLIIRW